MTLIPGINVGSAVVPFDDADDQASHKAVYGLGGLRTVADLTERNNIMNNRREEGMQVYVQSDSKTYRLLAGFGAGVLTDLDFEEVTGGGGASGDTRPTFNDPSLGSDLYVDTAGDDTTGDGSIGLPYATIGRAYLDIGTMNPATVTINLGAGTFDMPGTTTESNWITILGTESVAQSRSVTSVDTLSDADGIALTIDGGPFADDVLRGQLIKWTSGPASGDYGWIYRNTGNQIFVTNEDPDTLPVLGTDSIDFIDLDTNLQYVETPVMQNSVQFNIQKVNMMDDAANGRVLFVLTTDKIEWRYCNWTMARPQVGGFGRAHFWCNYIGTKGATNRGVFAARNDSYTLLERGTVIDCGLNTDAANKRFVQFSAGASVAYKGQLVIRQIDDTKGIQCDGTNWLAADGIGAHDTLRFEDEGIATSCIAGFVFNTTGEGIGGAVQLPNLHGAVTSDYVITAKGGPTIVLGLFSSVSTATVDKAVSASNGFSATAFGQFGTIIIGGDPFTSGFVGFNVFEETGNGVLLGSFDQLTTGSIVILESNSPETDVRNLVEISNNNASATGAVPLRITQEAAAIGLFLDQNGNGNALRIDSQATTSNIVNLLAPVTTSGICLSITNVNSLTIGAIAAFTSNSADTNLRDLIVMKNDNSAATQARVLGITQDSQADGIYIDKNSFENAINIDQDANSTLDAIGILIDVNNAGVGASIGMHMTAGHLVIGSPVTMVTDRAIHTFGTANGIQLERTAGVEGIMQVAVDGTFIIEATGDMIWGDTDAGNYVFLDESATTIQIGDMLGDSADVHLTVDNATGFIAAGGSMAVGQDTAPDSSAVLDIVSTTKGLLIPRMTNAQITAITSPVDGLQAHSTDDDRVYTYDAGRTAWVSIAEIPLQFGKNNGADNQIQRYGGDARDITNGNGVRMPWGAILVSVAVQNSDLTSTTGVDIYKNGVVDTSLALVAGVLTDNTVSVAYSAGDTLNLAMDNADDADDAYFLLTLKWTI